MHNFHLFYSGEVICRRIQIFKQYGNEELRGKTATCTSCDVLAASTSCAVLATSTSCAVLATSTTCAVLACYTLTVFLLSISIYDIGLLAILN